MRKLILLMALAVPLVAAAEVYKWVDEKGVVHYTDKPPADNAKPAKLPPLQTYKGGTNPDLQKFDKGPPDGKAITGGQAQIQIVAPTHDETFRSANRTVPIAVVVTPAMTPEQKLIYMIDGTPLSTPTTDTSFAATNVDRGTHTASVTLIGPGGEELGRSQSITFHMAPPSAVGRGADSAPTAPGVPRQPKPSSPPTKP